MSLPFAACGDEGPANPDDGVEPLPEAMALNGVASIEMEDGRSAHCTIFLHVELDDDGEEVDGGLEYRGSAGGDAVRTVLEANDSGFVFWPHLHSGATVRVTHDSIELMADGHDTVSARFYRGIMHFAGARTGPGEAAGEWTCAPLDIDSDGWLDTSIVAQGTWTISSTDPIE